MNNGTAKHRVAILGAGIMGCSVALYLASKKIPVLLIDKEAEPFSGASRWNEGKIHLGYLYGADPSLQTAKKLIPGGLNFPALIKELTGREIDESIVTSTNDLYLVHRDSVVAPDEMFSIADRISTLVRQHPDADNYFIPLSLLTPRRLSPSELAKSYNTEIIQAAIEVPERSVSTNKVADFFIEAVAENPLIQCAFGCRVVGVESVNARSTKWNVRFKEALGNNATVESFSVVVNALWEGRKQIDATLGLETSGTWTNRFRLSLFARMKNPVAISSAVIAVGPFGDVKNYNGMDLYLSWYEDGLLQESHDLAPPQIQLPDLDQEQQIIRNKLAHLGQVIPEIAELGSEFAEARLKGGWVYAAGKGSLSNAGSDLHKRNKIGTFSRQGYFSVDTGKYSIAPWLAKDLANQIQALIS